MAAKHAEKQRRTSWIPLAQLFAAVAVLLVALFQWPRRWLLSGTPILTYCLIAGEASGHRILPFAPLWTLVTALNLAYAVAATSWLLYWVHTALTYPVIFIACMFQFQVVSNFMRRRLRILLKEMQFTKDKLAYFDIPALEIDRDVDGLMVIRGLTISLSSLTVVAHGVEVGIKFSDDLELALVVDTVTIRFFRSIHVGDVYGNVKGGEYEMTFGHLEASTSNADGDPLMNVDTPLLQAAAASTENLSASSSQKVRMTEAMTDNSAPKSTSVKAGLDSVKELSPDDDDAAQKYRETLDWIEETSIIRQSRDAVWNRTSSTEGTNLDVQDVKEMRAAICSELHDTPTIAHPPRRSIKVTTLQNLSPPHVRRFLHRLPLLLRILLNQLAYFHPISIDSITAGGSGKWMQHMIESMVFKGYPTENAKITNLQSRISKWLSDANFALQLCDISGLAQVPIITSYDIRTELSFNDVLVYRTSATQITLKEVIRIGGADATVKIPSFLMPHHEHLLPPSPTRSDEREQEKVRDDADGKPATIQAQRELDALRKDETNAKLAVHVRLPACFDQELLDFVAALVKATKLVEIDRDSDHNTEEVVEEEVHKFKDRFKEITGAMKTNIKDGIKKATVDAVANDRWIAKLVGKVTRKLETAQGDIGYSGDLPIPLKVYRDMAEDLPKILP